MKKLLSILFILGLFLSYSCNDSEDPEPPNQPLNADAGPNLSADVNETVTLDGSQSTGPAGFTYSWSYEGSVPEADIVFQNKNTAKPTLVPPSPGYYEFTLTISHGDSTDTDETSLLVGGAVEIGGTLTEDLELKNIQSDASLPDYIVTSDLVVPDGLKLSITEDDVIIEFNSETGIHVQEGGLFSNANNASATGYTTELRGQNGWKGILIESGSIDLERALIINAGKTVFSGQPEPASVSFTGNLSTLVSLSDNEFVNSNSYDILALDRVTGTSFPLQRNKFSYNIPIKAQIQFMELWTSNQPNLMPDVYDYIQLVPGGANKKDVTNNTNGFSFYPDGTKFFIDGDFWAGSSILIGENVTILMKENTGMSYDISFTSNPGSTIGGLEGKTWKGIAAGVDAINLKLAGTSIEHAGYGKIVIGNVDAQAEASLYWSSPNAPGVSKIEDIVIKYSGGYGYYDATTNANSTSISNTTFVDPVMPPIKTNILSVNNIIKEGHGNTFELSAGMPAVVVTGDGTPTRAEWYALGGDNYYLIDGIITAPSFGPLAFNEGVILKFKSNKYFNWPAGSLLEINGRTENPVVFDSESGKWGGLYLAGNFQIDNLIIKNGGGFMLPNASAMANIVSDFTDIPVASQQYMKNSSVSSSGGWGIVVETGSYDFVYDEPAKNNSFSGNTSGDITVK